MARATKHRRTRSFDDTQDDNYENPSYEHDEYEMTLDDHKRHTEEGDCCSLPKLAVFFIFLGLTFGLVFGFVDLDRINSLINADPNSGGAANSTDPGQGSSPNPTLNPTHEPYDFMQCPPNATLGECCNGLPSNCDLRVNEIMWAFVHNANHNDLLLPNHDAPLEEALEAGYRGLALDACWCPDPANPQQNRLVFCHGACTFGHRDANEVFANIHTFLDNHPSEVIFINFEISSGSPSPDVIWEYVKNAGLRQKSYIQGNANFPTMRNFLSSGKQLILAKHRGFDCTDTSLPGCTPRIFEFYRQVIENHFNFETVEAIEDSINFCNPYRGTEGAKRFYSINNFLSTDFGPSRDGAAYINQKSFVEKIIRDCRSVTGYDANIISVDFWNTGDLPRVVQETNIARAKRRKLLGGGRRQ